MRQSIFVLLLLLNFAVYSALAEEVESQRGKIGMILPLTGSYASGGVDNQRGIEAAMSVGSPLAPFKLIFADSKAEAATGISEFRRLVTSENIIAAFVMRGSVGMPLNPVSQSLGIPLLGAVGNSEFASTNKFAFQVWSSSDEEGAFLAQLFRKKYHSRVAIFTVQDDWQSSVADGFRSQYKSPEFKIVLDTEVLPAELDFRATLLRAKAASADAFFANLSPSQIGPFLKQARELEITSAIYSNFWVAKNDVINSVGAEIVEGVRFIEMDSAMPTLQKLIAERFQVMPSGATLSAYVATLFLQQVFNQNPHITTKEELYSALLKQVEVKTPDGPISIIDRRVKFPLAEKIIRKGKVEIVVDH